MHTLLMLAGALLGVAGPRRRGVTLMLLAAAVPVAVFAGCLAFAKFSIAAGAGLIAAVALVSVLLARGLPEAALFLLVLVCPPAGRLPIGSFPKGGLAAFGAVSIAVSATLAWKFPRVAMRIACALIGARLISAGMRGEVPLWQTLAIAVALFAAATFVQRPETEQGGVRTGLAAAFGFALAVVLGGGVIAAWALAPTVGASPRAAAIGATGLVWALPSEAISWDPPVDRAQFPMVANLDAKWLSAPAAPVVKLPGTTVFNGRFSLHSAITPLREIKDDAELAALRTAATAVVEGLRDSLPLVKAGMPEAELARALMDAARNHGCEGGPSFPPVVTAGPRAAAAHGTGNDGTLKDGDLVVIDIGCFAHGYASDFTRTFPVGGKFSEKQRKLYDATFEAQQAALEACKPGVRLPGRNDPASLDGVARAAIKARGLEDHNAFGIGHTVGLFVHDVGPTTTLRPGMVITIEPGIYLKGELGIRIEDTYVVTKDGCVALTQGFPADAASVERALGGAR